MLVICNQMTVPSGPSMALLPVVLTNEIGVDLSFISLKNFAFKFVMYILQGNLESHMSKEHWTTLGSSKLLFRIFLSINFKRCALALLNFSR